MFIRRFEDMALVALDDDEFLKIVHRHMLLQDQVGTGSAFAQTISENFYIESKRRL